MSNYYNRQWRLPNNENKDKQSNYSLLFDSSSSQYITVPNNSSLDFGTNTDFTLSMWVKRASTGNFYNLLFNGDTNGAFWWRFQSDDTIRFFLDYGSTYDDVQTTATITDTNWHHLVAVADRDTQLSIYIDGQLSASNTVSNSGSISTTLDFKIGARYDNTQTFSGQIDAVAIFNYALSSSQVTTLYGSSSTGIGNPMTLNPKPIFYAPLGDQDSFNGAEYLVPNSSLKDYVFSFDGTDDYIDLGRPASLNLMPGTDEFTVSAWFNCNDDGTIYSFGAPTSSSTSQLKIVIRGNSAPAYHPEVTLKGTSTNIGSTAYNDSKWHHIVVSVNTSNANVYIDGQNAGTATIGTATISNTENGAIGARTPSASGGGFNFDGSLSNVQVFNTALSSTDAETLYNNGSPLTSMTGFTSLVSWYKLNASATYDGTNWTIPDDSTNSNAGTSSGMTQANLVQSDLSFTSGYSPYALDFDGTNDYITLGSGNYGFPSLTTDGQTLDNFSISCWFKWEGGTISGSKTMLTWWKTGSQTYLDGFLQLTTGNVVRFGDDWQSAYTFPSLPVGWYHITAVKTTDNAYVYVNGSLVGTKGSSLSFGFNRELRIGGNQGGGEYWDGALSNISLWNAALTSSQVSEIYNEGVPSNLNNHSAYSNLVSWWQLGSNSSFNTNWTVLNEISTGTNGTSVNMTEADIVDGVGSYANGLSSGMGGDEVIGDAPYSTSNSLSVNMDVLDRTDDTPS